MRVLVFGDSIAQGFWDTEGGWVARLRKHYDELEVKEFRDRFPNIFNLGISGDRAQDVLKRIKNETEYRLWPGSEIIYIFAVGLNDTVYRELEFESTPEKYKEELDKILEVARNFAHKIMFLGITPVVDERTQPLKWSTTGKCYSNERVWMFEQELRDFCGQNKLVRVPLFEKFKEEQQKHELMPDGVHPNNEGHELIYQLVRPKLDKLLSLK